MLNLIEFTVLVAITSVATSSNAQVVPGLGGRPTYKSNAGAILLDKLDEASDLLDTVDDQAAAVQAVLTQMSVMASGGSLSASQGVMALFGESYEPVPPYLASDGIYNLPFAPVAVDGTVGPTLISLEGGTAVLETLVLGDVAVDTSVLPANIQQYYSTLTGLGVQSLSIYAARFSAVANPAQFFEHFGFAHRCQLQGQELMAFSPLGVAVLGPATFVDYVQVFADASGMAITVQPTQQAAAPAPVLPTSPTNPALDECLAEAAADLEAALQGAASKFSSTENMILSEMANYTTWASWGALGALGITAISGILIVYSGGTATGALATIGAEAVGYLAGVGGLTASAISQIAAANQALQAAVCNASNSAVQAGSACFEAYAPNLKDDFDADAAAALQTMGC